MPKFTLHGRSFDISVEDLELKMVSLEPAPITRATYTVEAKGKVFPIKQLIMELSCLPAREITTLDAYTILKELGFSIRYRRHYY